MRVDGKARATSVLLLASRAHHDGLLQCAPPRGVQRPHVEDVDALHLSEDLKTLDTGGLLHVGGDGTGGGTGTAEVVEGLDVCEERRASSVSGSNAFPLRPLSPPEGQGNWLGLSRDGKDLTGEGMGGLLLDLGGGILLYSGVSFV